VFTGVALRGRPNAGEGYRTARAAGKLNWNGLGCDSDEVRTHCRDATAVRVRGCWVCDRVLSK